MYRYVFIIFLALGVVGLSSDSYAQIDLDCSAAVKCVCESQNHVRVVKCPDDFATEDGAIDCTGEELPEWTCGIDCSAGTAAVCDEIPFECKRNEVKNCLVTLPLSVSAEGSACAGGESDCSGQCVDTNTDPENCGSCGVQCAEGAGCSEGVCGPSDPGCPPGEQDCAMNNICIDLSSDPANCGACGLACAFNQVCTNSQCVFDCAANETVCNGQCVDTGTNVLHCGGCDNPCGGGQVCTGGACVTP